PCAAPMYDTTLPYESQPLHPGVHEVPFTEAAITFSAGNDAVVYLTSDLGGSGASTDWSNLSSTLAVTQFYHGTSQDLTHLLGGNQDNGTTGIIPQGPAPPDWKSLLNGDGGWTAMIPGSTTFYT